MIRLRGPHNNKQHGMTLPEVLVALLVFATIASTSVYALRISVDSRDQLEAADAELKAFQIARTLMKEDFAQIVDRSVRDEFGNKQDLQNQVRTGRRAEDDERVLASFVRNGWINPESAQPRSSLQYIEYIYKDAALIRRARVFLDADEQTPITERVLFDGLENAEAGMFLKPANESPASLNVPVTEKTSGAVYVTITPAGREPINQYFWIGMTGGRNFLGPERAS